MRTTDDPWPGAQRPLGEKVVKPAPVQRPEWKPLPHNPGVEQDKDGHLRTTTPLPK